jgi:catechol 2,3-dioxygenase-like lactoylglutathione lyase family enzyme
MHEMKLDALYVVVQDMTAARTFYARLFEREPALVDDRFSGFDLGGVLFGLLGAAYFGEAVDTRALAYGNNCVPNIRVSDLDGLHARIQALAPPEITAIQDTGTYRLFQVQDADGNRVEFYQTAGGTGREA